MTVVNELTARFLTKSSIGNLKEGLWMLCKEPTQYTKESIV